MEQMNLYKKPPEMDSEREAAHFHLLEQKVGRVLELVKALRQEKANLAEKAQMQEENLSNLSRELSGLQAESHSRAQWLLALIKKLDSA